jgi:hypothetical protein
MTVAGTGATSVLAAMSGSSARSAAPPASRVRPGVLMAAAYGSIVVAAPTSLSVKEVDLLNRPSIAPPTMAAETGATSAALATHSSSARSAALPAFRVEPGAWTDAASGSTTAAVPTSPSAAEAAASVHLLALRLRRSSPALPTMAAETGVMSAIAATSASAVRSADRPAFRVRPGAPIAAESGSTRAAAQSFWFANPKNNGATSLEVAPFHLTSLKPSEKNRSAS